MDLLLVILAFAFGACIGSFLNVVVFRLPRACLALTKPLFSFCPFCKKPVRFYDNIPIVSYVVLGAKCRDCKHPIAFRYFFVELLTALLFAMIAWWDLAEPIRLGVKPDLLLFAIHTLFTAALIVCTFVDIDLRIIPDAIDKPGMVIAALASLIAPQLHTHLPLFPNHPNEWLPSLERASSWVIGAQKAADFAAWPYFAHVQGLFASLLGIATGASLIIVIGKLGEIIFRKEAMGFGDVKFMGMIGGVVGWDGVILGFLAACVIGAVVGMVRLIFLDDRYIWFGPFLAMGAFLMMMFREPMHRLLPIVQELRRVLASDGG